MLNNLIARAIVPVTIAVTGFVIFGCFLLYSFVKSDMTAEALRNLDSCASTVVKSTRYAMMEDDRQSLQNIVTNISTRPEVELIRIYDQEGKLQFSGQNEPEKFTILTDSYMSNFQQNIQRKNIGSQHEVDHASGHISVSMPILNEGKCSTSACHFHAENELILGYLIVGVSSEQLEKTLALLRSRMIIFSLMVLVLTVGGVTALLRMNLFLPILRLTHNVDRAVQGVREQDLLKADHKLGNLSKNTYLLIKQRDQARQSISGSKTTDDNANEGTDESRIRIATTGHQTTPGTGPERD